MKKTFLLSGAIALATSGVLIFTACSKKDSAGIPQPTALQDTALLGKWELINVHYTLDDSTSIPPYHSVTDTTNLNGLGLLVAFKTDSSYSTTDITVTPNAHTVGNYYISNGKLFMKDADSSTFASTGYSVIVDTLTLHSETLLSSGVYYTFSEKFVRR